MSHVKLQRCRLSAAAYIHGRLMAAGEEFYLREGERGPHRTRITGPDMMDANADQKRILAAHVDEPLYEVWDEATKTWMTPNTDGS